MKSYFKERFRVWRLSYASASTSLGDELSYPPKLKVQIDPYERVRQAEKTAGTMEFLVDEHLQSAYDVWQMLPDWWQRDLWILELARSVDRSHKEVASMNEQQQRLEQENEDLKMQVDKLNRLQQPRRITLQSSSSSPSKCHSIHYAPQHGREIGRNVDYGIEDLHVDTATVVANSIERWKNVVTSNRAESSGRRGHQRTCVEPCAAAMSWNLRKTARDESEALSRRQDAAAWLSRKTTIGLSDASGMFTAARRPSSNPTASASNTSAGPRRPDPS